jgi:hypothetical protein
MAISAGSFGMAEVSPALKAGVARYLEACDCTREPASEEAAVQRALRTRWHVRGGVRGDNDDNTLRLPMPSLLLGPT